MECVRERENRPAINRRRICVETWSRCSTAQGDSSTEPGGDDPFGNEPVECEPGSRGPEGHRSPPPSLYRRGMRRRHNVRRAGPARRGSRTSESPGHGLRHRFFLRQRFTEDRWVGGNPRVTHDCRPAQIRNVLPCHAGFEEVSGFGVERTGDVRRVTEKVDAQGVAHGGRSILSGSPNQGSVHRLLVGKVHPSPHRLRDPDWRRRDGGHCVLLQRSGAKVGHEPARGFPFLYL